MKTGQWSLDAFPVQQSKEFLRMIYTSDGLQDAWKRFDQLNASQSFRRQSDTNITLERFLTLSWRQRHLRLQVNSPREGEIRYCAALVVEENSKFAWVECSLTEHNYQHIRKLFKQAYKQDLETTPALTK